MRFLLFTLLLFVIPARAEINQDNDFQVWSYSSINKSLCENVKVFFEPEFRWGDNASTLYFYYFQGRVYVNVCSWLDIAPGYRHQYIRPLLASRWLTRYVPMCDIYFKKKGKLWSITDRNRFQYLLQGEGGQIFQYRNRLMFVSLKPLGFIYPVFQDEIFLRNTVGLFENRLGLGGEVKLGEHGKLTLFYILRHIKLRGTWRRHDVLWLWARFEF